MQSELQNVAGIQPNSIYIEQVNLLSPFSARNNIGMLIMQPLIKDNLKFDKNNGYVWVASKKEKQLADLEYLMNLAQDPCLAGHNTNTNIVLIPEYGIPGMEGINLIKHSLEHSVVQNQIIIGGVDGLAKNTFLELLACSKLSNKAKINIESVVTRSKWVNTAIIFEKAADEVNIYLQPKMLPSPLEQSHMMCEGNILLVLKTASITTSPPICLLVPICFDWIGRQGCTPKLDSITADIINNINGINNALWIIAAIQHNDKPSNYDFMNGARERLTSVPWIDIYGTNACIVMANTASDGIDEDYGKSSFIYHQSWTNSRGIEPEAIFVTKNRPNLQGCKEHRFREDGPVIHSLNFFPVTATMARSGDSRYIFSEAKLVCLDEKMNARCASRWPREASSICAYVKNVGDYLDNFEQSIESFFNRLTRLIENFDANVLENVVEVRLWDKDRIKAAMALLCKWSSYKSNCDEWNFDKEGKALEALIKCKTLIFSLFEAASDFTSPHGNFKSADTDNNYMFICDGSDEKDHYQLSDSINDDIRAGRIRYGRCQRIVVIGKTSNDTGYNSRGRLTGQSRMGSITDVPPVAFIPFRELLSILDKSNDVDSLRTGLIEKMEEFVC